MIYCEKPVPTFSHHALGTALLFGAAWSRVSEPLLRPALGNHGLGFFTHRFIMTNVFLVMLATLDWRTRGRLYRATAIGAGVIVVCEAGVTWIYHKDWWLMTADAILRHFPGP